MWVLSVVSVVIVVMMVGPLGDTLYEVRISRADLWQSDSIALPDKAAHPQPIVLEPSIPHKNLAHLLTWHLIRTVGAGPCIMQFDVWGGGGRGSYLLEARTRRRICRDGEGEVRGCSVGTQPEVGVSAPGGKPQGWADHRLTGGYLMRERNVTEISSEVRQAGVLTVQAHRGGRLEGGVGVEHVRGAGGRRGLRGGDGEAAGQWGGERGGSWVRLRAVIERGTATGVLLTLTLLTVGLRGPTSSSSPSSSSSSYTSSNSVVVVVVAGGLRVVVGPRPSSTPFLSIPFLPSGSIFIVGIVLNNKIITNRGRKLGVSTEPQPQLCLILTLREANECWSWLNSTSTQQVQTVAKIIGKYRQAQTWINGLYFSLKECEERMDNTYVEIIDL